MEVKTKTKCPDCGQVFMVDLNQCPREGEDWVVKCPNLNHEGQFSEVWFNHSSDGKTYSRQSSGVEAEIPA